MKQLDTTLPIDSLVFDPRLQMRRQPPGCTNGVVSNDHADGIAASIKARTISPKVRARVWRVEGMGDLVTDGHHFIEGSKRAGKQMVPAKLFHGTWEDALADAAAANPYEDSPLKLTRADKENAVCAMIRTFPGLSSRAIAKHTRTSDFMVRDWKAKLIEMGEVKRVEEVEGLDGKIHPPAHSGNGVKKTRSEPTKKKRKERNANEKMDWKGWRSRIGWLTRTIDKYKEASPRGAGQYHEAAERNLKALEAVMDQWKQFVAEAAKEAAKVS